MPVSTSRWSSRAWPRTRGRRRGLRPSPSAFPRATRWGKAGRAADEGHGGAGTPIRHFGSAANLNLPLLRPLPGGMSPPGRPKGEYRRAQPEGPLVSPPGRPKGEYRRAQPEGTPVSAPGRPTGEYRRAQREGTPVSRSGAEGAAEFVGAPAPTDKRARSVPLTLITRLRKLPARRGERAEEVVRSDVAELDADGDGARTLRRLQAAALAYRTAFGPPAGHEISTLQGGLPRGLAPSRPPCADIEGFSLHAALRSEANRRKLPQQLCRGITRRGRDRRRPAGAASAGRSCRRGSSTSTSSTARTASAGSSRSSLPSRSGR